MGGGDQEVIGVSGAVQLVQMRKKGGRIASPEDESVHIFPFQRDGLFDSRAERNSDVNPAGIEVVAEPLAGESGNVASARDADDHCARS